MSHIKTNTVAIQIVIKPGKPLYTKIKESGWAKFTVLTKNAG
jgi:hypothetical protein